MTKNPMTVKQDTDINEVIDIILQRDIMLVPVVDDKHKLIGLVGRPNIFEAKPESEVCYNNRKEKRLTSATSVIHIVIIPSSRSCDIERIEPKTGCGIGHYLKQAANMVRGLAILLEKGLVHTYT